MVRAILYEDDINNKKSKNGWNNNDDQTSGERDAVESRYTEILGEKSRKTVSCHSPHIDRKSCIFFVFVFFFKAVLSTVVISPMYNEEFFPNTFVRISDVRLKQFHDYININNNTKPKGCCATNREIMPCIT